MVRCASFQFFISVFDTHLLFYFSVSEISEIGSLSPTACECGSTDVKLSTVASSLSIYGLNLTSKCIGEFAIEER